MQPNNGFSDFRVIQTTLTYKGYEPFVFKFRRQLSKELVALKDRFYDLEMDEKIAQLHNYRVETLSKLLIEHPNIPGWNTESSPEESFKEFFSEDLETVDWIWRQYQDKLYPKEIIAMSSE